MGKLNLDFYLITKIASKMKKINNYLRFMKKVYIKNIKPAMKSSTSSTLKNFIKLQYIELSSALQFINVPKLPNIPEPIIPPLDGCDIA